VSEPLPAPRSRTRCLILAIALVAVFGAIVSALSLYYHFSSSRTSFCDVGPSFNCDLVNRSQYSTVLGLPVALIGVVGYCLILALATIYREKAEAPFMLLLASLIGLGFALYLTYIEARVLDAWCLLCLSSLGAMAAISVLAILTAIKSIKRA
jgi:vitamin-K-epoxide reductase (warfarin-sensitive)